MKLNGLLRRYTLGIVALLVLSALAAGAQEAGPPIGVVIAAHGAPMEQWNMLPRQFADEVDRQMHDQGLNMTARIGFLEFARPSIADAVADLRRDGIERIVVVPIFVTASEHTVFDLPCVLGTAYHPETMAVLAEEGAELVPAGTPLILGPPLCCSGLLPNIMLERARELSEDPATESVLVFAHGAPNFAPIWHMHLQQITKALLDEGGFAAANYAFVGVGHGANEEGLMALHEAAQKADRLVVLGLYVAMGADAMVSMWGADLPDGADVVAIADRGLLPHPELNAWVIRIAAEMAGRYDMAAD